MDTNVDLNNMFEGQDTKWVLLFPDIDEEKARRDKSVDVDKSDVEMEDDFSDESKRAKVRADCDALHESILKGEYSLRVVETLDGKRYTLTRIDKVSSPNPTF